MYLNVEERQHLKEVKVSPAMGNLYNENPFLLVSEETSAQGRHPLPKVKMDGKKTKIKHVHTNDVND